MRRTAFVFFPLLFIVTALAAAPKTGMPPVADPIEVCFSPNGGCTDAIVRELGRAKSSVRIQAYSFTSSAIAKAIIDAKKRGVQVEAVLDKSNRTDKYSGATFLKNQGCDVLIDAKHAIAHNKIMIIDEKVIITGSFNFTKNAEEANAENLLVIREQPKLVEQYLANFRLHQKHAVPYDGPSVSVDDPKVEVSSERPADGTVKFMGSKNSDVYHYPGCPAIQTITPKNLVEYDSPPPGKRLHAGCQR